MNCYDCKHIRSLPGDCHKRCAHPSLPKLDPFVEVMAIFASVQRTPPQAMDGGPMNVKLNPLGVARGWCNFPWNFDPTWIVSCDGYEVTAKEVVQ